MFPCTNFLKKTTVIFFQTSVALDKWWPMVFLPALGKTVLFLSVRPTNNIMDESSKFELEQRVRLYQFYVDCYIKGIAFFLAITAALLKFAMDSKPYRTVFAVAAIICTLSILIPLIFGMVDERKMARDFRRLAEATKTTPTSTAPLRMLAIATAYFWLIVFGGWIYILCRMP
ncbi:MAG: hypothetical protein U0984_05325 [Prosthecobacter sp.]|nr:hypothetical protein [Prosthecobacter sp.]